jgi:colanic acid/amylovoran biosynthesis protein
MSTPVRHIVILNLHSAQNAGDAALLEMAVSSMLAAFPAATLDLAMNEPAAAYADRWPGRVAVTSSFSALCQAQEGAPRMGPLIGAVFLSVAAALMFRLGRRSFNWLPPELRRLLLAYMRADVAVSCPGNIFATKGRVGMPFLLAAYTVGYALLLGKPLYVLPQSIGPLRRRWERVVVRRLYGQARHVFVREPVSLRLAQEIGLPAARLSLAPDMAFALPAAPREEALVRLRAAGVGAGPRVGVTVINRLIRHVGADVWERYEAALADTLAGFARSQGATVIFFPQVIGPTEREDDRVAARRIIARMDFGEKAILLEEPVPPALMKAMYREIDILVATRMHSAIFALGGGVPTLMIEYLHKIRGLAEMLGLAEWTLSLTETEPGRLRQTLDALWENREAVRRHLDEIMPGLVREVESVGEIIGHEYYTRNHTG